MTNEPFGRDPSGTPQDSGADEPVPPALAESATTPAAPPVDAAPTANEPAATAPVASTAGPDEPADAEPGWEPGEPAGLEPGDNPGEPTGTGPVDEPGWEPGEPATTPLGADRLSEQRLDGGAYPPPNFPPPPPNFPPPPNVPPTGGTPPPAGTVPGDGPRFGTPPPGGWGFAPGTDGYATRYGLARPTQGRVLAGVCAAIGRASNTDPVLWRVLFAVFSLAGGLGIVLYLLGWLLIPAEGDSGSPLEALLGRGRTSSNPIAVLVVAVGAAIGLSLVITHNRFWSVLVVIGIVAVLVVFGTRHGNITSGRPPTPYPPGPPPYGGPTPYAPPVPPTPTPTPTQPAWQTGAPPVPPTYRPPFAPHGPYGPAPTAAERPPYPYPGLTQSPPAPAPRPPRPPKQRSKLGLLTWSAALLVTGLLGVLDLAGLSVPFRAYVAVALAVVGLGMIVGTWLGRSRGLIGLGLGLAVVLAIASVTGSVHGGLHRGAGDVRWQPATAAEVADSYSHGFGDATLDLSKVDFTGQDKTVELRINAGDTRVILPPTVDVEVRARIDAGNGDVLGHQWDGVNTGQQVITDQGTDGAGGGHLVLDVRINAGQLEVHR